MRPCTIYNNPGYALATGNYFVFNQVGTQLWRMSKGKICNREPKGWLRYVPVYQRAAALERCAGYIGKP